MAHLITTKQSITKLWLHISRDSPSHDARVAFSHYSDVMITMTGVSIAYSTVCSGADQRKPQSSTSPVFVRGIHRWRMDASHKGPSTWKMFPFDDVIMYSLVCVCGCGLGCLCVCPEGDMIMLFGYDFMYCRFAQILICCSNIRWFGWYFEWLKFIINHIPILTTAAICISKLVIF